MSRSVGSSVFGLDPEGYDQSRFGYPDDLFVELRDHLSSPLAVIGEIGPGTGIATRRLLELGPSRYVAFEPDAQLAGYLLKRFPTIEIVQEDFVAAEVTSGFDLIAAAASFHWLDPSRGLQRARKLLKPGGIIALWWNVYTEAVAGSLAEAAAPLVRSLPMPPSIPEQGHYSLDEALHRGQLETAGFDFLCHRLFETEVVISADRARALYASFSFVRMLDPEAREKLLDAIAKTVAEQFAGKAPLTIITSLYLARAPSL